MAALDDMMRARGIVEGERLDGQDQPTGRGHVDDPAQGGQGTGSHSLYAMVLHRVPVDGRPDAVAIRNQCEAGGDGLATDQIQGRVDAVRRQVTDPVAGFRPAGRSGLPEDRSG